MRHQKNIFKDKSFMVMAGVSVLALAGIGTAMLVKNNTSEQDSGYISDLNGNNLADNSENNLSDENINSSDTNIAANGSAKKDNNAGNDSLTNDSDSKNSDTKSNVSNNEDSTNNANQNDNSSVNGDSEFIDGEYGNVSQNDDDSQVSAAGASVSGFHFSIESKLVWPVETSDIVIDFSPDATVYFATLDKYKTNDSVCIRSEVGTPVYAACDGIISDIGYNEEIGNSVSMDLGDGYSLCYGQIKDIQVNEGDVVNEGDLLCYVANPTKYYSVEGANLYLKLTNGDTAVDPLDFLDY